MLPSKRRKDRSKNGERRRSGKGKGPTNSLGDAVIAYCRMPMEKIYGWPYDNTIGANPATESAARTPQTCGDPIFRHSQMRLTIARR